MLHSLMLILLVSQPLFSQEQTLLIYSNTKVGCHSYQIPTSRVLKVIPLSNQDQNQARDQAYFWMDSKGQSGTVYVWDGDNND